MLDVSEREEPKGPGVFKIDVGELARELTEALRGLGKASEGMREIYDSEPSSPRPMSEQKIKAAKLRKAKRKRGGPR